MAEWPQLGFGRRSNPFHIVVAREGDPSLRDLICGSRSARIATAFVTGRGLRLLEPFLKQCGESVRLVVGLGLPTEPKALRSLLQARSWKRRPEVRCYVSSKKDETFHPKAYLFRKADGSEVGLVGSANLSGGGLQENVECCVLVRGREELRLLGTWFEKIWGSSNSLCLSRPIISKYEGARKKAATAQGKQTALMAGLAGEVKWLGLVDNVKRNKAVVEKRREQYGQAWQRIRKHLDYCDSFRRAYVGWKDFLMEPCFGGIRLAHCRKAVGDPTRLARTLTHLADEARPLPKRVDDVLPEGGWYIKGFGLGVVSKVLIACDRRRYAVYNGPVKRAYECLGGQFLHRGSKGEKYADFCEKLRRVSKETNLRDMVDVDILLYEYGRENAKIDRDDAQRAR